MSKVNECGYLALNLKQYPQHSFAILKLVIWKQGLDQKNLLDLFFYELITTLMLSLQKKYSEFIIVKNGFNQMFFKFLQSCLLIWLNTTSRIFNTISKIYLVYSKKINIYMAKTSFNWFIDSWKWKNLLIISI